MQRFLPILLLLLIVVSTSLFAETDNASQFGGVGLQVVPTVEGDLVVLRVVEGTPASEQGLLPGDLIFQVDGHLLKGSEFGEVVADYLWGPVGSNVLLHYRRPGQPGRHEARLQRISLKPQLTVTPAVQDSSTVQ